VDELVPADDTVIARAFRRSLLLILVLVAAVLVGLWLARDAPEVGETVRRGPIPAPPPLERETPEAPVVRFTDITLAAGIDFLHVSGAVGEKLLPETMGAGAAFFDTDADGDQDLLLVNSDHWLENRTAPRPTLALFRNDGSGRFENMTVDAGLDVTLYGQGVAAGDYDDDGRVDLFITALGENRLFRNLGKRFRDVTREAGVAGASDAWSTGTGFLDYDNDGDLDLFVCNYVQWTRAQDLEVHYTLNGIDRAYGPPRQYPGAHSSLYRNEGDGTFTDVAEQAGIRIVNPVTGEPAAKSLAATFVDADGDGFLDIFVANDTVRNFIFRNRGDGTFAEVGTHSGLGFDTMGNATGAMGIDAADYGNNGLLAVGIANLANETTSFFVQQGDPWQFVDMANILGIGSPSLLRLSFGAFFFDFDLDGRLDFLQANGHLEQEINEIQPSQHYRQPAQLFWNRGPGARPLFAVLAEEQTGDLDRPLVGRGATYADIDGDGDLDVLITQAGDRPVLLRNDQSAGHHWLRVRLAGKTVNRDAVGVEVRLRAGGVTQRRRVMPTRSYLSQVELPVTFGLGGHERVDSLTVHWPGKPHQEVTVGAVDRTLVVEEP
jgi:hypothetical protein